MILFYLAGFFLIGALVQWRHAVSLHRHGHAQRSLGFIE